MGERDESERLRGKQRERKTEELELLDGSRTPDEADQHRRRAAKADYLERKLAERERSERDAG
jgi:hypothetical protein